MMMEVNILYLYKGAETNKTIKVLGSWGSDCRVNLNRLIKEEYLLLALTKTNNKLNTEYNLFDCGEYFIKFTIWMYCIYLVLSIIALYIIYRIIKKIKKYKLATIVILFFSFKSFSQLPNYQVDQLKLSKKKVLKLKPIEQVVKINSNDYIIYLDKKTFNSFLPIANDAGKASTDTIDLNPYYKVPNNIRPIEQAIYKTALTGKILVKCTNGTELSKKIYTCKFEEKNRTGCVRKGECIYIKKTNTILLAETTSLIKIANFLD